MRKNMKEFYDFHRISRTHFAQLAKVAYSSLMKYELGEPVRYETKLRIEVAMQVIEDYKIFYNQYSYGDDLLRAENRVTDKVVSRIFDRIILLEL